MKVSVEWTPEREAALRSLVFAGKTYDEIGRLLGVTKNAALGKSRRMRLERSPDAQLSGNQLRKMPRGLRNGKPLKRPRAGDRPFPGRGRCVWPHGDPGTLEFHFCAERVAVAGAPYCASHMAKAYVPASKKSAILRGFDSAAKRVAPSGAPR